MREGSLPKRNPNSPDLYLPHFPFLISSFTQGHRRSSSLSLSLQLLPSLRHQRNRPASLQVRFGELNRLIEELSQPDQEVKKQKKMVNHRCVDGKLDASNYSSPMPVIGLYIIGATAVCLAFIVLDIYAGFRNRKRWLPCRLFPLNSVTLTLLAVAAKLPVDLTTSMPSAQDQLSKLTGTTFICVCMGFLMPSLGLTTASECLSNMIALTIFVITVLVNMCIQLHTGVIISFQAEHIIVLCCMMLLLMLLWLNAPALYAQQQVRADRIKCYIKEGRGSLLQRLKVCYLYSYDSNPQLLQCRNLTCPSTCALCIVCAAVLLRVICRSVVAKELEFCEGISDYGWSMWAIVLCQTITILVGCLGITIRLLTMIEHLKIDGIRYVVIAPWDDDFPLLGNGFPRFILCLVAIIVCLIHVLVMLPYTLVYTQIKHLREVRGSDDGTRFNICKPKDENEDMTRKYKEYSYDVRELRLDDWRLDDWVLKKSVKDMKRWMEMNRAKVSSDLNELLHRTRPSQEFLTTLLKNQRDLGRQYKICLLSIVVLTRIVVFSISSSPSERMRNSLEEVYKVLYYIDRKVDYIDRKVDSTSSYSKLDFSDLKSLWDSSYFRFFNRKPKCQSQMSVDQAIKTIKDMKVKLEWAHESMMVKEVDMILGFIENKVYLSMEDLYRDMEQLFVDMLNELLVQLPGIILKEITDSTSEDLEERVKHALKAVSEIEKLEGLIRWSFPVVGTTITSLVTDAPMGDENIATLESNSTIVVIDANRDQIANTENQISSMPFGGTSSTGNILQLFVEGDVSHDVVSQSTQDDEIIQIE